MGPQNPGDLQEHGLYLTSVSTEEVEDGRTIKKKRSLTNGFASIGGHSKRQRSVVRRRSLRVTLQHRSNRLDSVEVEPLRFDPSSLRL